MKDGDFPVRYVKLYQRVTCSCHSWFLVIMLPWIPVAQRGSLGSTNIAKTPGSCPHLCSLKGTLWLFNIAMENGPFIDGLPITVNMNKNGDFPWLC